MKGSQEMVLSKLVSALGACGVIFLGLGAIEAQTETCPGIFFDGFESGDVTGWDDPGECFRTTTITLPGGVTMDFVPVPSGTFSMGSPVGERGRSFNEDQHDVTLTRSYDLGETR